MATSYIVTVRTLSPILIALTGNWLKLLKRILSSSAWKSLASQLLRSNHSTIKLQSHWFEKSIKKFLPRILETPQKFSADLPIRSTSRNKTGIYMKLYSNAWYLNKFALATCTLLQYSIDKVKIFFSFSSALRSRDAINKINRAERNGNSFSSAFLTKSFVFFLIINLQIAL